MPASFNTSRGIFNAPEGQEDLFRLLLNQIQTLESSPGPVFPDISGAFGQARGAAQGRQTTATGEAQAQALERAAAKGKTLSSAQTSAQSRISQEGATSLSSVLAGLGIQEQGILSEQAAQTAQFEEGRRGQINDLLGLLSSIETSGVAPDQLPAFAGNNRGTPSSGGSLGIGRSIPEAPRAPTFDISSLFDPVSSTQRVQQRPISAAGFPSSLGQGSAPTIQDILGRLGNIDASQMEIIMPFLEQLFGQQSNSLNSLLGARNVVTA